MAPPANFQSNTCLGPMVPSVPWSSSLHVCTKYYVVFCLCLFVCGLGTICFVSSLLYLLLLLTRSNFPYEVLRLHQSHNIGLLEIYQRVSLRKGGQDFPIAKQNGELN